MICSKYAKFILVITLSLMFQSCGDFLKGKPKKEITIEVSQESMSCLKNLSLDLKKFLKSESTDSEIENTFNCIDETLNQFQNRVEGRAETNAFTAEELYEIFDKFIKDAEISKAATEDLLTLKSAMLGGESSKISKTEISSLRAFLKIFKNEVKNILPYAQLFSFKKTEVVFSKNMVRNGFAQLSLSLKNLLKASKIGHSSYEFNDLKKLVVNLKLITEDQNDNLVLFKKVSDILTGGQSLTNEEDKALYIDNICEVLRLYALYLHGHLKFDLESNKSVDAIFENIQLITDLLENSVQYKKTKMISFDDIKSLITEFSKKEEAGKVVPSSLYQQMAMQLFEAGFLDSNSNLNKADLNALKSYLVQLKTDLKNLKLFDELFKLKRASPPLSKDSINEGFLLLNKSLKNFVNSSNFAKSGKSLNDLISLISNIDFQDEKHKELSVLFSKVNSFLIGDVQLVTKDDKNIYIDNITEVLKLYSIHLQGYVKFEISDSKNMDEVFEFVTSVLDLFENSVQYKKTKIVSIEAMDALFAEILKKDILPIKISTPTALNLYKLIAVRVFESGLAGNVYAFSGLKKIHFINIKRELAIYRVYNQFIQSIASPEALKAKNVKRIQVANVQQLLNAYDVRSRSQDILKNFDKDMQEQIIVGYTEIKNEFLQKTPVLYRFNKIILASNQEIWDQNWLDLSRGLYYTMLSRQLLSGWGKGTPNNEIKYAALEEQGFVQWYSEFKAFGIEAKIFDPRSKNSGASNLISANLFTRSGNGDNKMNFRESNQFLGILFSGGGKVYGEMAKGFAKANCNLPEKDVFGNNWNKEACAYNDLRKNYKHYFSNLPYLVHNLNVLNKNEADFKEFYDSLMLVARNVATTKGSLETADIRTLSTLIHYMESIFSAYDFDRNYKLSESEIKSAYPKFKNFAEQFAKKSSSEQIELFNSWKAKIAGYGCFNEEHLIRESFVFMVYNGKLPQTSDLTILPCLRKEPLIKFKGEVERKSIINTFKIIKSVLG
jgi:hypothetical protein